MRSSGGSEPSVKEDCQEVMDRQKRQLRQLKRAIKRAGNKTRRQELKRELAERPEDAPHSKDQFGRHSSRPFNGIDRNPTLPDREK
jgi:hypothetical protein